MTTNPARLDADVPHLLTVHEVAQRLGVSRSKVYELVATRALVAYRPGGRIRITPDAVRRYLEQTRVT